MAVVGYCRVEAGCVVIKWGHGCSCGGFDEEANEGQETDIVL